MTTHIESLVYSLQPSEFVVYDNPPPVKFDTDTFEGTLENNVLTCRMKAHFATESEARTAAEGILRAWEIDAALRRGYSEFRFVFQKAVVVECNPSEGSGIRQVVVENSVYLKGDVRFRVKSNQYPAPPQNFSVTLNVETLWARYEGYLRGREPLLSMAYFCFTVILATYNGRANAAKQLNIAEAVLKKMGKLTSTMGDSLTARKVNAQSTERSLSSLETTWLQKALRTLIRRLGESQSSILSKTVDMKDLPSCGP